MKKISNILIIVGVILTILFKSNFGINLFFEISNANRTYEIYILFEKIGGLGILILVIGIIFMFRNYFKHKKIVNSLNSVTEINNNLNKNTNFQINKQLSKITIISKIIIIIFIISLFFPLIPIRVKRGFNGVGGEFCGIIYYPECDEMIIKWYTLPEAISIIKYNIEQTIKY